MGGDSKVLIVTSIVEKVWTYSLKPALREILLFLPLTCSLKPEKLGMS